MTCLPAWLPRPVLLVSRAVVAALVLLVALSASPSTVAGASACYDYGARSISVQRGLQPALVEHCSSERRTNVGHAAGDWVRVRPAHEFVAPNTAGRFVVAADGTTVDLVGAATRLSGKGDLTAAGHALSKHGTGQRAGSSAFPALSGNQQNWNLIAQGQIDDILSTGQMVQRTHPNHGPIIEVFAPDGRGARWYADGRFFGFLEP